MSPQVPALLEDDCSSSQEEEEEEEDEEEEEQQQQSEDAQMDRKVKQQQRCSGFICLCSWLFCSTEGRLELAKTAGRAFHRQVQLTAGCVDTLLGGREVRTPKIVKATTRD